VETLGLRDVEELVVRGITDGDEVCLHEVDEESQAWLLGPPDDESVTGVGQTS
jgi:hypothetical protein